MNDDSKSARAHGEPLLHGVDWAIHAGATEEVMRRVRRRILRRRNQRLAGAAGAMAILSIVGFIRFATRPTSQSHADIPLHAAPASRSAVVLNAPEVRTLPDGSVVEMRKGAELSVEYSVGIRRVTLTRGDAYFKVMKNDRAPFIVATRGVETRAVGTAFAVQVGESTVEVLVAEGRVAVRKAADLPQQPDHLNARFQSPDMLATVDAGACVVVDTATLSANVFAVADAELRQRIAWRTPLLEFTRTPLSEVVAAMNRTSRTPLILGDPHLAEVRISGTLRADNIETLLHLLAGEYGIEASAGAAGPIVLQARR